MPKRDDANNGHAPAPGLATASLREEHSLILRLVDVLERAGRRMAGGGTVRREILDELVTLVRAIDEPHHAKEEQYLFPALRARPIVHDPPIETLLAEHIEQREYLMTLTGSGSTVMRAAAALLCASVLRKHIDKEERVLFPIADTRLSTEEQAALAGAYGTVAPQLVGPKADAAYLARLEAVEAAIPS